jgi:signal transduction histidine kinase
MRSRLDLLAAHLRALAAAYAVLVVGLLATAAVYLYVANAIAVQERGRFEELAHGAEAAVRDRMDAYVATLRAARGLFAGREPSRAEFRRFVQSVEIERYYPGIQGIGFARVVRPAELAAHEAAVRAEGFPGYRVWPEGPRDPYTAIVYLEPFDWRNQRAFGYDMMAERARREAMERARDSGQPASTARVELVQEAGAERQAGFNIYLPVYDGEARTVAERRLRIRGFVYAPFRAGDLLRATVEGEGLSALHVEIHDGEAAGADTLYDRSGPPAEGGNPSLARALRMEVAGRPWTLRFAAPPGFVAAWERWLPRAVALAGVLVALLLFQLTRREVRSRDEALRSASRARFLADAGKLLSASLDYRATLRHVAQRAAEDQADACVVLLFETDGAVRLVGHRDPSVSQELSDALAGLLLDPEGRFGAAAALRRGEPFVTNEVDAATWERLASEPSQRVGLASAGIRGVLTVPLLARGERLGAISFVSTDPRRRFGGHDVSLATDLARLAVSAIDTARLYRRAQDAVRLRDEFLSIASHELKTPLTSLALQSESLRAAAARGNVPEPLARKVEVIRRNVDRLARLIASLLDISRIESGRLELDLEEVDLADVARDVAARFEEEARRAGCELSVDAPPGALGRWDRLRVDQVVTNLVSNALKYGHGKPVQLTVRGGADRAVLTVQDQGIGIAAEAQARIFERFERAVSERHYGGFGLGLWIVRRIVEALGGEIRVESEPGHGSTFTLSLPPQVPTRADGPGLGDGRRLGDVPQPGV